MCGTCVAEYNDHVAAVRLRHCCDCPGLHRHWDQALLHILLIDGVGRRGERLVDLAVVAFDLQVPRVALVGAELIVDHHSIAERVVEVDDCFERLVRDVDRLDCIAGRGVAGGQHARHAVARIRGLGHGQWIVRRIFHVGRDRPGAGHRTGPQRCEIGAAVGGNHPRHRRGGGKRRPRDPARARTGCGGRRGVRRPGCSSRW